MKALAADDQRHGTYNGYQNLGCRCAPCRQANSDYIREQRHARRARGLAADDPKHGRASTYSNHMCRCGPCTTAHSEYRRKQRAASS